MLNPDKTLLNEDPKTLQMFVKRQIQMQKRIFGIYPISLQRMGIMKRINAILISNMIELEVGKVD